MTGACVTGVCDVSVRRASFRNLPRPVIPQMFCAESQPRAARRNQSRAHSASRLHAGDPEQNHFRVTGV